MQLVFYQGMNVASFGNKQWKANLEVGAHIGVQVVI